MVLLKVKSAKEEERSIGILMLNKSRHDSVAALIWNVIKGRQIEKIVTHDESL